MRIYTSCGAYELANDAGEGEGGLWTNHFIAKGLENNWNHNPFDGQVLTAYKGDGTMVK